MYFSYYKPWRIDHDKFTDNDFDDDRQPEIAIWPPKPEVVRKYDRCRQSPNGKPRVFEISTTKSEGNRRKCSQAIASMTEITDETGNTNISETVTGSTLIPTSKSKVYDYGELEKSVGKWSRQRPTTGSSDMAPKPKIFIYIELWHVTLKFHR